MTMNFRDLAENPKHFSDCCAGISKPLIRTLVYKLPVDPAVVLSIGSGSGLLETTLLHHSHGKLNLYGVEVPSCENLHLPPERLLRVPCTRSLHPDAFFASALLFVYPRSAELIKSYLEMALEGALEQVLWLGQKNDYQDVEKTLLRAFVSVEHVEGPGILDYELLAIASKPRTSVDE